MYRIETTPRFSPAKSSAASAEAGMGPRYGIRPTSTAGPSTDATASSRVIARHRI